jgi:murein DD-endopeptidase MepM/ murein hydrolase activator NlpD
MFRSIRVLLVGVGTLALLTTTVSVASAAAQVPSYIPPVDAPVRDPYRPPATPYGPGNRGIEYATDPGAAVRASADGVVAFAGPIGPDRYVSVDHADGVRTSYSYLETIAVHAGQEVRQGEVIGTASDRLHFGARRDGVYFDPATLFAVVVVPRRAHLVPVQGGPWT